MASSSATTSDSVRQKLAVKVSNYSNFLTRSKTFKDWTKWAFEICDADGRGTVERDELYAGILLVHLKIAKKAGPAACSPPSRKAVNDLFEAADHNKSGNIDEDEFEKIMVVCCAQIFSRMVVYYLLIILLVPYVATVIMEGLNRFDESLGFSAAAVSSPSKIDDFLNWCFAKFAKKAVAFTLFAHVVPRVFDLIDTFSKEVAASESKKD